MARIRTIKPEFWTSGQVMELSRDARLAFIGLLNFCDDAGIHPASPKRLKAEVFPADDLDADSIAALVREMISCGLVAEYSFDGESFWIVTGWHHQKIDQPTYKFPRPDGTIPAGAPKRRNRVALLDPSTSIRRVFAEHSSNVRGVFTPGKEGKGKEKTTTPAPPIPLVAEGEPEVRRRRSRRDSQMSPEMAERFERFYECYPRKAGRAAAEKAFARLSPDDEQLGAILAALAVAKASREWLKDDGEFIPHPSSWLNGKRWTDEVQAQPMAYTETELAVIDAYNDAMPGEWSAAEREVFVPGRAAAIRDFLSLAPDKPDLPARYFSFCAESLAADPRYGLDWLLRRETYAKVREGAVKLKEGVQ
ncbi:hypothetical protein VSR34_27695 [Paraburkholderia sp. JHI2823]|uniref:hypothetical protein n=1 Tax=Paraburkholderia sp. JHI2823 TaxID=3112960 RepID=UPI00317C0037